MTRGRPLVLARSSEQKRRGNLNVKRGVGGLLLGAMLSASQLAIVPAHADEAQMQRQIDAMQRQLVAMQRELAQSKKQSAERAAAGPQQAGGAAPAQVVTARNGNEIIIPTASGGLGGALPGKGLPTWVDGIHVSMAGSFIAFEGAWRERSEVANGASDPPFGSPGIPLQNS